MLKFTAPRRLTRLALTCLLATAASTALLPAHASLFGKKAPEAIALDPSGNAEQLAAALDKQGAADLFTKNKKIAISSYRVVVVTEGNGSAKTNTGIGSSPNDRNSTSMLNVIWTLVNLPPEKLQAMVDAGYAQLRTQLQTAGYELVDVNSFKGQEGAEVIFGKEAFKSVQPVKTDKDSNAAIMVTASGLPVRVPAGFSAVTEGGGAASMAASFIPGSLKSLTAGYGAVGDAFAWNTLANKSGVSFVDVALVLDFVDLQGNGKSWLDRIGGNQTATVKSRVAPTFTSGSSGLWAYAPGAAGSIRLNRAVTVTGDTIANTKETTTTGDKAGAVGSLLLTGLMALGTGGKTGVVVSETKRWEAQASDSYTDVVGQHLNLLNTALVQSTQK